MRFSQSRFSATSDSTSPGVALSVTSLARHGSDSRRTVEKDRMVWHVVGDLASPCTDYPAKHPAEHARHVPARGQREPTACFSLGIGAKVRHMAR